MPGSQTAQGRSGARISAPSHIAFRSNDSVGTPDSHFAAQWLAYAHPCQRFVIASRRFLTHDSGTAWFARPSPCGTFTQYSLPVYPALPFDFPVGGLRAGLPPWVGAGCSVAPA